MFENKTSDEIQAEMIENIDDTYEKTKGYFLWDTLKGVAIAIKTLYSQLLIAFQKLDIESLVGSELDRFVSQRTGIERRTATYATGILTVTGNGTVEKGSFFETKGLVRFEAVETTVIEGEADIVVQAVNAGINGNVPPDTVTQIPITITGINKCTNKEAFTGGYREESDEELRIRYYDDLQQPIISGNKNHYIKWAKEVPGVGKAKCFSLAFGPNTVEVCIIGNDGLPASPELIEDVQNYIDPGITGKGEGEAPAGAYCTVTTATEVKINITGNVKIIAGYNFDVVKKEIETNIKEFLKEKSFDVDYISYAQIANVIFNTSGIEDYSELQLNGSISNIPVGEREVATLGEVNLSEL